mmetsp:Transcript_22985/g.75075  ORF Transcript_22985/g.75075 Transcript_22985/m.75075 type:complete len:233 (+) Transcript_22985:3-701(+)
MHQYSGVKKGYRPARTSRGYRSKSLGPSTDPRRLRGALSRHWRVPGPACGSRPDEEDSEEDSEEDGRAAHHEWQQQRLQVQERRRREADAAEAAPARDHHGRRGRRHRRARRSLHSGGAQGVRPPCRPRSRPLRPARRSGKARRLQELLLPRDRQAHHVLRAWPAAHAARDAQEAPVLANVGGRRRAQCRRGRGRRLLHLCVPPVQQAGHRRALGAAAPARGRRRARSGHGG